MDVVWNLVKNNVYASVAVCVATLFYFLFLRRNSSYPPGPYNLPIVGYLPFLGSEPHEKMIQLAEKYGSIFSLRLGMSDVVVLADYDSVKEAFNKSAAIDRPANLFHFIPSEMGLASVNGEDWTEQRRYSIKTMRDLGLGKSKWEDLVQDEVRSFVRFLESHEGRGVRLHDPLLFTISNNILSLLFGAPLPQDDPRRVALDRGFRAFPDAFLQTGLQCVMPALSEALAKLGLGDRKAMKDDLVAFNTFVRKEIDHQKESIKHEDNEGFVCKYLNYMKSNSDKHSSFNESSLVGNVQAYIFGGIDTTVTTLHWALLAMAAHPGLQRRVHDELDRVLGAHEPRYADHDRLPYTMAAVLEVMRWRTLVAFNLLHETSADVTVGKYVIPKGTVLLGLLEAIHRDPKYWPEPDIYRPERFLDDNGQVIMKKESFVPFSTGKRRCVGENVAMVEVFVYFAAVMRRFGVSSAGACLNLKGTVGIVLVPEDQELRFELRD
ncbi:hypothetical protein JTE90_021945 [Oedothorax gibbosus]|uniref:Cytochrome P450 n=1 Tax=Oedothorax gibbosus TaxID=931172 RepID=A0AAV6V658_9ARAC|nr:hypothetical protein JTE90_021945 [Oedothorax gibbosus]